MTTLSFHGDAVLKAVHVAQAEHHAAADMLVAGTYGNNSEMQFRGCSVGCFAHDIDPEVEGKHQLIAETRGLPEWLVRLQDSMFEGLPREERASFHVELARRIPVGVDLEPVQHWVAMARIDRMLASLSTSLEARHGYGAHEAIEQTIAALIVGKRAHEAAAGGNICDLSAADSAWSAESAESAAESAESAAESARSAARSAWSAESAWSAWSAAWSAWSAARSAAESAESAAWSAAESAAWSAARSAAESAESAWLQERDALFSALDRAGQASD